MLGPAPGEVWPMFASNTILVRREVEAFSFGSLVADCGGVLGLFLGFNFLMLWEWMWNIFVFLAHRIKCLSK